jgi:hypothetical protein
MVSLSTTVRRSADTMDRGGFLARLGAVVVGAAAASTLAAQEKAAAVTPPVCCYGLNRCSTCSGGSSFGCCCWWCQPSGSCHMYACCDRYNGTASCSNCGGGSHACNCICSYLVCTGCC